MVSVVLFFFFFFFSPVSFLMHSTEVARAFTECPAPSEVALENKTLLVGKVQLCYVKTGNMCMSFLPDTGQGWKTSCSLLGPYAGSLCQGFSCILTYCLREGNLLLTSACSKVVVDKLSVTLKLKLLSDGWYPVIVPSPRGIPSELYFNSLCGGKHASMPTCWLSAVVAPLSRVT